MKTSELSGAALDWAVGKCRGITLELHGIVPYSTDWAHGGPVIEKEKISIKFYGNDLSIQPWGAHMLLGWDDTPVEEHGPWPITSDAFGPTPLIAAMRCYVASKLGEEVEVPDELTP